MSSKCNFEEHEAEFHLETDLEAMEMMRPDTPEPPCVPVGQHSYQDRTAITGGEPNGQYVGGSQQLGRRRPEQVLPRRPELARWQQEVSLADHRYRSNSVPSLELRHQSSDFALSLRQIGDEYNEARSPTRQAAISSNRRRSSADFQSESAPERESSWLYLSKIVSNLVRRMSGASISPGQLQALGGGEDAADGDDASLQ